MVSHDPTQRIGGETFPNLDQMAASPNPMNYYERLVRKKGYPAAQQMAIQLLLRLCLARPQDVPLPFRPCATHYSTPQIGQYHYHNVVLEVRPCPTIMCIGMGDSGLLRMHMRDPQAVAIKRERPLLILIPQISRLAEESVS